MQKHAERLMSALSFFCSDGNSQDLAQMLVSEPVGKRMGLTGIINLSTGVPEACSVMWVTQ